MFKIAYYDNIDGLGAGNGKEIPAINKSQVMHELVEHILDWTDSHDALLTIKTKERKPFRALKHGPHWTWFKRQPAKEIYKYYPLTIRLKIARLERINKLVFNYELDNLLPAIEADCAIVVLRAESAFLMLDVGLKNIVIFDQHHYLHHNGIMRYAQRIMKNECVVRTEWREFKITDEVEFFDEPAEIERMLNWRYEKWKTYTGYLHIERSEKC